MKNVKRIIITLFLVLTMIVNTSCTSIIIGRGDAKSGIAPTTKTTSRENTSDVVNTNFKDEASDDEEVIIKTFAESFIDSVTDGEEFGDFELAAPVSEEEIIAEVYSYVIALVAYDISRNGYEVSQGIVTTSAGESFIGLVFEGDSDTYDVDGVSVSGAGFIQLADKTTKSYLTEEKVRNGAVAVAGEESFIVDRFIKIDAFSGFIDECYFTYRQENGPYSISLNVEIVDENTEYDYGIDCYDFNEERTAWKKDITRPTLTAVSMYSEEAVYDSVLNTINEMMKLQEKNYYNGERCVFLAVDPAIIDALYRGESLEAINGYLTSQLSSIELKENQFLYISATEGVQVFEVADIDEMIAERKSNGWMQVVVSGGMLLGSVVLACVTFGASTPAVITSIALVSGAIASIYAVSNLIEGIDNIKLANAGDVTTPANNPVRNVFIDTFGEDGAMIYNIVGFTALTIQSLIIPANAGFKIAASVNANVGKTALIVGRAVLVNLLQTAVVGASSTYVSIKVEHAVEKHTGNTIFADWSGLAAGFVTGVLTAGITNKLDKKFNFSGLYSKQNLVSQMQEISRDEAISDMKPDKWAQMTEEEQKAAIERLVRQASKDLGLDETPVVKYENKGPNPDGSITKGSFSRKDGSITINLYKIKDSGSIISTIYHEVTHAKQFQLLNAGVLNESTLSLKNYITYKKDPAAYYAQACEREAFMNGAWYKEIARGIWYE